MNNYAVLKNKMKFEIKIPYQNIPKLKPSQYDRAFSKIFCSFSYQFLSFITFLFFRELE